jgi:hypothetical protein
MREYHVRFCERFGVKLPLPTRLGHDSLIKNYLVSLIVSNDTIVN